MEYETFQMYVKCIPILQARELLDDVTASSFPHNKNQKEVHRKIHKAAHPDLWGEKKAISLDQLMGIINGRR